MFYFHTVATCPLLGDPFGGSVTFLPAETPNTFGTTATFSCDEGFVLLGEGTLMCEADQEWSEDVPTCSKLLFSMIMRGTSMDPLLWT